MRREVEERRDNYAQGVNHPLYIPYPSHRSLRLTSGASNCVCSLIPSGPHPCADARDGQLVPVVAFRDPEVASIVRLIEAGHEYRLRRAHERGVGDNACAGIPGHTRTMPMTWLHRGNVYEGLKGSSPFAFATPSCPLTRDSRKLGRGL